MSSRRPKAAQYTVKAVETPEEMAQCMAIRHKVFIDEQGYEPRIEVNDPNDPLSVHFLLSVHSSPSLSAPASSTAASLEAEPAGTARLNPLTGQLSRFAILPAYRGLGLGRPLCDALHGLARQRGLREVWCDAQADRDKVDATGFYTKAGYVPRGATYIKEGTVHQKMVFDLSTLPDPAPAEDTS